MIGNIKTLQENRAETIKLLHAYIIEWIPEYAREETKRVKEILKSQYKKEDKI